MGVSSLVDRSMSQRQGIASQGAKLEEAVASYSILQVVPGSVA